MKNLPAQGHVFTAPDEILAKHPQKRPSQFFRLMLRCWARPCTFGKQMDDKLRKLERLAAQGDILARTELRNISSCSVKSSYTNRAYVMDAELRRLERLYE